jgi:predicted ATP-grasp superfamily ATP-dependent carboligase
MELWADHAVRRRHRIRRAGTGTQSRASRFGCATCRDASDAGASAILTRGSSALDQPASRVGAVVVGGDYQGLGIVRSLGRRAIPTCIIDDEWSVAHLSRYATHARRVPNLRDEQQAVEAVLETGRRLGLDGWVLFPTRDETVAAFSRHRQRLSSQFRVPTPDWEVVRWACDKRNTYRLADSLGIPTPRTWYPASAADLAQIDVPPPYVVKPAVKEHFIYATGDKAWRADTHDELSERYRRATAIAPVDEIMIQELVPGAGEHQFAYCAFYKYDRALGSMVVRRQRQHPPEFGRASTFVQTVDLPQLEELSERLLRKIGFYGLVELEYKFDPRDGQYKLLDINARTWGYHSIGPRAGVDFPSMLFSDQVGLPVEARRGQVGVRWIRLVTDFPTAVLEILKGTLGLRPYLSSLRRFDVESVFCREDLLPGFAELALIPYLSVKRGF